MNGLIEVVSSVWKYRSLMKQLVVKDIKLKYRRSFLGYVWSVLNPLLIMIVMAIVFSSMFRRNIENFPLYLFTGQILFNFMNQSTHQALTAITGNAPLIKKTYVPNYIFTFAKITSGLMDLLFSMGALFIVMLFTGAKFSKFNLLFVFPVLQLYIFSLGLGMVLSALNVYFRDIQYIYNAFTTAWLYLTPIFYPLDALPENLNWSIKHLNPMYFYIGQFRDLIYSNQLPGLGIILEGWTVAVIMFILGIAVFRKKQGEFILYI